MLVHLRNREVIIPSACLAFLILSWVVLFTDEYSVSTIGWIPVLFKVMTLGVLIASGSVVVFEASNRRDATVLIRWIAFAGVITALLMAALVPLSALAHVVESDRILAGALIVGFLAVLAVSRALWRSPWVAKSADFIRIMSTKSVLSARPNPTLFDSSLTAVHESGHALLYACLLEVPENMRAESFADNAETDGLLGRVQSDIPADKALPLQFILWRMLCSLAGRQAEATVFGKASVGSETDLKKWEECARSYIMYNDDALYFANPLNQQEAAVNAATLAGLKSQHASMLSDFFQVNRDVLVELAKELERARTLTRDNLLPYLARVVIPDGFPRSVAALTALPDN